MYVAYLFTLYIIIFGNIGYVIEFDLYLDLYLDVNILNNIDCAMDIGHTRIGTLGMQLCTYLIFIHIHYEDNISVSGFNCN